jgi:hypothetical protein
MKNELPLTQLYLSLILQIQQEIQSAAHKFNISLEREESDLNPEESMRLFNVERKRERAARERARLSLETIQRSFYNSIL